MDQRLEELFGIQNRVALFFVLAVVGIVVQKVDGLLQNDAKWTCRQAA
jgi:hypothetical protein